jgi:phosphoketolase
MNPLSALVAASADPVVEIGDQQLHPAPDASLTGQLINQSGQIVNVAHVLGTFYDKSGQVVWVADQYVDKALLPQNPVPFQIHIPEDLAKNVVTQRTVVATYSSGGSI